ncbi:hypothetical protein [Deinococcus arcticus]|uniref:Lipoprotein n=1 Tax=Deinococcus arcticus TaxID=2136176 RepID=A0A2T3W9V8_9DEIO|nr:hypothetical protein [Deinococcus arcticus]PTA68698.1 hypothetical protein C8263_05465 [Deinococcus arcticus]
MPFLRRAALLGLLALGRAAASCEAPEELLTVRVGASERGTVVVRLSREGPRVTAALLPPEVLRPAEAPYIAAEVLCDGVRYVRLNPDLTLTYREDTQELLIRPAPSQLGTREIDVGTALRREPPPVVPAFGVDFGARATLAYDLRGERPPDAPATSWPAAQAYVGVGGATAGLTGYVGAITTRGPDGTRTQLRGTAQFSVTPELAVYAAYNATPGTGQVGFSTTEYAGVTATYARRVQRVYPRLTLQLDSPAEIAVFVNTTLLGTLSVQGGELSLLNIPLSGQGRQTIRLLIETESGIREQVLEVPATAGLPGGGLLARAQVGRAGGQWTGELAVQGAPTPTLLLQGQVQGSTSGALGASVQVRAAAATMPEGQALSGGVGVAVGRAAPKANPQTPEEAGPQPLQVTVSGSADYVRGPLTLTASAALPLQNRGAGTAALRANYDARPWAVSGRLSSGFTPGTWEAEVGVTRAVTDRGSVTVNAAALPGGYRVQVRGSYVFSPALQVGAAVGLSPGRVSPSATVAYQLSPAQNLSLVVEPGDLMLGYSLNQGVKAELLANTRAASGQLSGALSLLGGEVRLSPVLAQRGVLLRTGIPRLPLIVDGTGLVTADARGDLLITEVLPGQVLGIRVNSPEVPLGVAVAESALSVVPAATGLTLVDWRDNFTVSTFVRFAWAPGEVAASADLYLDGERIPLDDEGYGLVRRSLSARTGELRSEDGQRRCAVRLDPGAETATCAALPPP